MNTTARSLMLFFLMLLPLFLRGQWVDHFDRICGIEDWMDVQVTEGWNIQALEALDISATYPGELTMMPYTVSWFANWRGPLIYKMVDGDFVLTTRLRVTNREGDDLPGSAFSLGGVMIRNPKTLTNGAAGWMGGEEDYVFLSIGQASTGHPSCWGCPAPHFEVKSTINSNSTLSISSVDTNEAVIRLVRLDAYVLVLYQLPGQSWVVHQRYSRADLEDTLQVGMVTYTDWDKASTYEPVFHNSHVLNEDLEPDPSSNPFQPFAPDIITRYDFMECLPTSMPAAWTGLDLTNENVVTDSAVLAYYGLNISLPSPTPSKVWLGGAGSNWSDAANWLSGLPGATDSVRINSCVCDEVSCVTLPAGLTVIGGLRIEEGAEVLVPAGATWEIHGPFENRGEMVVYGQVVIQPAPGSPAQNLGVLDCRAGGSVVVME